MFIYILFITLFFISILAIISNNPVNSIIALIICFIISSIYFIFIGINYIAFLYLIIYVGAIAILFLFTIMMMNVRLCTVFIRGIINSNPCSSGILTTGLSQGEILRLNIAFQFKGNISFNQDRRVDSRVNLSMVRAILLKVYTIGVSHHGPYLAWNRICEVILDICSLFSIGATFNQGIIYPSKLWKGLPKESVIEINTGTEGSPKGSNSHGDRVSIVPRYKIYDHPNRWRRGSDTGNNVLNEFNLGFGETIRYYSDISNSKANIEETESNNKLAIVNKLRNLSE